jgi:hypothetical protein
MLSSQYFSLEIPFQQEKSQTSSSHLRLQGLAYPLKDLILFTPFATERLTTYLKSFHDINDVNQLQLSLIFNSSIDDVTEFTKNIDENDEENQHICTSLIQGEFIFL